MLYSRAFLAPPYAGGLKAIRFLSELKMHEFWSTLSKDVFYPNLDYLLSAAKNVPGLQMPIYILLFIIPLISVTAAIKNKNRLLLSVGIITMITDMFFIVFYSTKWDFFLRISLPMALISFFAITLYNNKLKSNLFSILIN